MDILALFLQNMTSPIVLFFALGVIAGFVKSDLNVPEAISRYLSIYLMMAIGFKGGVAISQTEHFTFAIFGTILMGVLSSFLLPVLAYLILRMASKLDRATAAAVAAHYGSISMVTFLTAMSFLETNGVVYAGYIVAVLALMEAPAIFTGLLIAELEDPKSINKIERALPALSRDILTNGSILLLSGSFIIGWLSGEAGMLKMKGFFVEPFNGILALFLLDMGLLVSRELHHLKLFNWKLIAFAFYMPLIGALIGLIISWLLGLDVGTGLLFTVLNASASYIAVTAAMRLALPNAKAAIYVPMSLAFTFPFNILIGIPLYYTLAKFIL